MRILNIHGYNGQPFNTNYTILSNHNYSVISQFFDYSIEHPQHVETVLTRVIKDNNIDLIVATSYGAFIGKQLSIKLTLPLIATNPCLRPDISLEHIDCEFVVNNRSYIDAAISLYSTFENDIFIVGANDEVVDPNITKELAHDSTIIEVPGGHHLDSTAYSEILLKGVKHIEEISKE